MRFWDATRAVLSLKDQAEVVCEAPFRINGFEGEVEEAMRCISAGLLQSPRMPHAETLALARWNAGVAAPAQSMSCLLEPTEITP